MILKEIMGQVVYVFSLNTLGNKKRTMIKKIFAFVALFVMMCTTCMSSQIMKKPIYIPNKKFENIKYLAKETSPYLLNYVKSNVKWYPWQANVLKKAKKENKMLLIDFGQLSCDVCVEKDKNVFEDIELAKFINDNFIAIKVDWNERPDIYKFFIKASEIQNENKIDGSLTALTLPDGKPFWLSNEIDKPQLSRTLNFFYKQYYRSAIKIEFVAEQLLREVQEKAINATEMPEFKKTKLKFIGDKLIGDIDVNTGGIKGAEKHPLSSSFKYLLRHYHLTQDKRALEAVKLTLDNMINGGLYDHVQGGFFSMSKGGNWNEPDFSKTLANNAQLISLFSEAYQLTKDPIYKDVVYETFDFLEKELLTVSGAFFSGMEGHGGRNEFYYTWTKSEVERIIDNELFTKVFCDYYNINASANKEERNVLHITKSKSDIISEYGLQKSELESILFLGKQKLYKARNKRLHPTFDNQIVTSWNALMLKGYVDAYRAFGNYFFLERAKTLADFMTEKMHTLDNYLVHCTVDGKVSSLGYLDDYSYTIEALTSLYQATFDEKWLYKAKELSVETMQHFYDSESGMFFYTSVFEKSFIKNVRFADIEDKFVPSASSSMANGLYVLSLYFGNEEQHSIAKKMMSNVMSEMEASGQPQFYANWCALYHHFVVEPFEVTIVGKDFERLRSELDDKFLPNVLLFGGSDEGTLEAVQGKFIEGETMIYVCKNKVCKMPTTKVNEALELLGNLAN